jgi:hypothetical protein
MGEGADGVAIGVVLWLVAVSVVMTAVGVWLARGHRLAAGGYLYLR